MTLYSTGSLTKSMRPDWVPVLIRIHPAHTFSELPFPNRKGSTQVGASLSAIQRLLEMSWGKIALTIVICGLDLIPRNIIALYILEGVALSQAYPVQWIVRKVRESLSGVRG